MPLPYTFANQSGAIPLSELDANFAYVDYSGGFVLPSGLVGNGVTDDTLAMQAFLDACQNKAGFLPAGTYLCNKLTIRTGTVLFMYGATIKASNSLISSQPLLINTNYDSSDTGIQIYGGTFVGNDGIRSVELVSLLTVQKLKIVGARFTSNQYIGLAIGGCFNFLLDNLELDNCGTLVTITNPAANLTLSTNTVGTGRTVTADAAVFAPEDAALGRQIWVGPEYALTGFATITGYTSPTIVTVTIGIAFASTSVSPGWSLVNTEGGAALWIGNYSTTVSQKGQIICPLIHDCEWAGMYATGSDLKIICPNIYSTKESGIFAANFDKLIIVSPLIQDITKKNISSSGLELGGFDFNISGGHISDTDSSSVSITDCQVGTITGLTTKNARRDPVSFGAGSHFDIITLSANPNQPRYITITGCSAFDGSSPAYAAVNVGNNGDAVVNIVIQSNNFSSTPFTNPNLDPIYIAAGKWSADSVRRNNTGSIDMPGAITTFGDVSVTLSPGFSAEIAYFNTPLTADRAVTLDTTAAYNGQSFTIVRAAGATGAHNINVGTGPLKALTTAGTACTVTFNGTAYVETDFSSL